MVVAKILVTLKNGILDPQGKTVKHALENLGFDQIYEVRMGKLIQLKFNDVTKKEAERITTEACKKLLANPVIEDFKFELSEEISKK
ncbi:MAG: phosphoribosylformylglycinamidine synthase subunit PurS [bacterium]